MKINELEITAGADLRGANLRDANLSGANLRGANLHEADLREANLREANLREADLREADLRGANLREANLHEADLREANLRWANLRGANLASSSVIDGGQDRRGYRFAMVPHNDGPRVFAGCRWFTLPEARLHWAAGLAASDSAPECLRKVEMMAVEAQARGWPEPEGGW